MTNKLDNNKQQNKNRNGTHLCTRSSWDQIQLTQFGNKTKKKNMEGLVTSQKKTNIGYSATTSGTRR
jgi:hypothetical protein